MASNKDHLIKKNSGKKKIVKEPEITTMGIYKTPKGYKFIKLVVKGDTIISKEESEEGMKAVMLDELKVNVVRTYMKDS